MVPTVKGYKALKRTLPFCLFIGAYMLCADTSSEKSHNNTKILIRQLHNNKDEINDVAQIWFEGFGPLHVERFHKTFGIPPEKKITEAIKDTVIEITKAMLSDSALTHELPTTLVALKHNKPIGMCTLSPKATPYPGICNWTDTHPEKKPWITNLVVTQSQRNQSIGKLLVEEVIKLAQNKMIKKVYFYLFDTMLEKSCKHKTPKGTASARFFDKPAKILTLELQKKE